MRAAFALAVVLLSTPPVFASPLCRDLFAVRSASEKFDFAELDQKFEGVREINRWVWMLDIATGGVRERATAEALRSEIEGLREDITFNQPFEINKDHESLVVSLATSYAYIKVPEPRVLYLREQLKVPPKTVQERLAAVPLRMELSKLEKIRAENLANIGRKFVRYKEIVRELEAYKADTTRPEFVERAANVLRHLGIDENSIRQNPELVQYIQQRSTLDAQKILRPSVEDLANLFSGKDANLSDSERVLPKVAMLKRDFRVQLMTNAFRRTAAIVGDEMLTQYALGMLKKVLGRFKAETVPDEMINRLQADIGKISVIASQFGPVNHLRTKLKTPRERYLYMRAMGAEFGSSSTPGVSKFMVTLARREDAIEIWEEIKAYIRTEQTRFDAGEITAAQNPNIVVGADMTMLKAMEFAETARGAGMLSSRSPYREAGFGIVKSASTITIAALLANVLYTYLFSGGDDASALDPRGFKLSPADVSPLQALEGELGRSPVTGGM